MSFNSASGEASTPPPPPPPPPQAVRAFPQSSSSPSGGTFHPQVMASGPRPHRLASRSSAPRASGPTEVAARAPEGSSDQDQAALAAAAWTKWAHVAP